MKSATLLLAVVAWFLLPDRSSAQVIWMGSGPVAVGGHYAPYGYAPSYFAAPYGFGFRAARYNLARPARVPLAAPMQYVYRDVVAPAGRAPETVGAAKTSPGIMLVADYGLGKREKEILQALDAAGSWGSTIPDLLKAVTMAALGDTKNNAVKKKKLDDLIAAYEGLAKNVAGNKKDFDVIAKVNQGVAVANLPAGGDLKATVQAVAMYLAANRHFQGMPAEIDDARRAAIVNELQQVVGALKRQME